MDNNSQIPEPKNTTFVPLAREIPQYRQAKLAGKRFAGPMRNIVSRVSDLRTTTSLSAPNSTAQPIKGEQKISVAPSSQTQTNVTVAPALPTSQTNTNNTLRTAEATLYNQSSKLQDKLKEKEQELAQMREKAVQRQAQLKGLTNDQKTAETVIYNLKQQLNNLEKLNIDQDELAALKRKIDEKEQENNSLKEEIVTLKSSLAEENKLEGQIVNYRNQIIALTNQQKQLQALVHQSEQKLQALTAQLTEEKQAKATRDSQIKQLEQLLDNTIKSTLEPPKVHKKVVSATNQTILSMPPMTKTPNAISGIVTDKNGKFIVDAVVLIKNIAGQNLRALKTNQLGQFIATTPLPNGKYYVEVTKSGYSFDIIEVNLINGVVPPIQVQSYEITA